jgi:signal transduction histidine kinase
MTETPSPPSAKPGRGLSAKVLTLTILFVMLGEVLIFLPSIANFRVQWLKARVAQAEIAALAAEAAPDAILDEALRTEILKGAGVESVLLKRGEAKQLMVQGGSQDMVKQQFDLRGTFHYGTLPEAIGAMFRSDDRLISVIDKPPNMSGDYIEIALHERPMIKAMQQYGLNILWLSIVLSLAVAAMIYAALSKLLVRPMLRLSANMTDFGDNPENPNKVIAPSGRSDELGTAELELKNMQTQLQGLLQQKTHLAALGLAVSKVSHDLRNMLTTAQLLSDNLAAVKDPQVQRFAPKLIASLDRAITFLNQTLKYGQAQEAPPKRMRMLLRPLVEDVLEGFMLTQLQGLKLMNNVPDSMVIDADREHVTRILTNLVRNAVQALEQRGGNTLPLVEVSARRSGSVCEIDVRDTGPGIPPAVRGKLFEAFQSAAKAGGTGLGLAIASELVSAHGGTIDVASTGPEGSIFKVSIPDAVVQLAPRQAKAQII